jgi:hypothetical protein
MTSGADNLNPSMPDQGAPHGMTAPTLLRNLLTYWRNSLADEDIMASPGDADELFHVDADAMSDDGRLDKELTDRLRGQWKSVLAQGKRERTSAQFGAEGEPDIVPVVLLAKALAPQHSHGAIMGERKPAVSYVMTIPALLGANDALLPDPENQPWIGREFLEPMMGDGMNIPVVGKVDDCDGWLDRNPVRQSTWADFAGWCDELWTAVSRGRVPEGFVLLDGMRIRAAKTTRDMGRQIRQVYDALLAESNYPPLLSQVCGGRRPVEITRQHRLELMAAPRGAMGASYGLASSQADAVAATTCLSDGEALAVNGPPGTGKTTLLQAIIATEVVQRALAGREPAIVFGCSTNNQAVTNINSAMNGILAENRSGDKFPWARRWVPDAETYGMYLPSSRKVNEAVANGFAIAVQEGNVWTRFPERELDPIYVAEANAAWQSGFALTYGYATEPANGIGHIRADLKRLLSEAVDAKSTVMRWEDAETWWRTRCPDCAPRQFIDVRKTALRAAEEALVAEVEHLVREGAKVEAEWEGRIADLRACLQQRQTEQEAAAESFDAAARLQARVEEAGQPRGLLELLATILSAFRGIAVTRQHARRLSALPPDGQAVFRELVENRDHSAWSEQARLHVASRKQAFETTRAALARRSAEVEKAKVEGGEANTKCERAIAEARRRLVEAQAAAESELKLLEQKLTELEAIRVAVKGTYQALCLRPAKEYTDPEVVQGSSPDWLQVIDRTLDVSIRHEMFQKAMRYWEGRWLIEAKGLCQDPRKTNKRGRADTLARFRRWCMLTPCLVSTLHSLPKHLRFSRFMPQPGPTGEKQFASDFLFGGVDVLIMDEAGQVAPHVGMAAFALANRAVVVGDVFQIEPVLKLTKGTDCANSSTAGLQALWSDGAPVAPHILSESSEGEQGSVMRVLQAATAFTSPGAGAEPGVFLSEHRRCDPEIVSYCNDLVYAGRLQALTSPGAKAPGMRAWGWAHVRGSCVKRNGSRVNHREAAAIADWIAKRAIGENSWLAHYQGQDAKKYSGIEKIVAVVTPFSAQAAAIKQVLAKRGEGFDKITVGTVHALQGAECPIVVFSPTYSAEPERPGRMFFDSKPNMLNVAVSRAKDCFVVIGDMRVLQRDGRRRPSSLLAEYLFREPENEIADVDGNHRFAGDILKRAERISTLERHREVLAAAFRSVKAGELLLLVSPFVSRLAVEADDVPGLCRHAVANGGRVHIVVEQRSATDQSKGAPEAVAALQAVGAVVHRVPAIHNKTLVVADRQIAEGSFNWLSAVRDRSNQYCHHEASYLVSGQNAKADIKRALAEVVALGAKIDARPAPALSR